MANELLVGVKIGAVLSGTFQAAFASARGTSLKLGQAADELKAIDTHSGVEGINLWKGATESVTA